MKKTSVAVKEKKAIEPPSKKWSTTSIAFRQGNLEALKAQDLHAKNNLSISWIVNKLVEKFLAGGITLDID